MKRDLYWDTLKFSLIFLVIYGHIISGCSFGSKFNLATYNFIYLFHMPLFVFISGRFSQIKDKQNYKRNILRLLETYIVFQVISSAILIFRNHEFSYKYLYEPNWVLWYLISLSIWRLIIYFIPSNWLVYRKRIITTSFIISLLAGFVPISYTFTIQKSFTLLPFFVLGYYSTSVDIKSTISKIPSFIAIGTLLIAFAILYFIINQDLSPITHCCYPYWSEDFTHTIQKCIARSIYIASAIILSIMAMRLTYSSRILSKWGSLTLFLFIYHTFVLQEILFPLIKTYSLPINELYLFVYSVTVTIFLVLLSHIKFFSILLNPVFRKC